MDVNRLEGSASVSTTLSRRRGAVPSFFLSDVGGPVLAHRGADGDVEHRLLDVLLDESTESGVIDRGGVDGRLVLVGFAVQVDLRARRHECIRKSQFQTRSEGAPARKKQTNKQTKDHSPARVQVSVTNRVNPALNRMA